jgi:hypothetical protein
MTPAEQATYNKYNSSTNPYIAPKPVNFSSGSTSDTVDANTLNGANAGDANTAYNNASNDFLSGTSGKTPTDSYMQSLYNSYQYTPEELAAKQQDQKLAADIITNQLQAVRQVNDAKLSGGMTTSGAEQAMQEIQRKANVDLANLNASRAYNAIPLSMAELQRQNNIQGLAALSPFYTPRELPIGTPLVNAQGQTFVSAYGGTGTGLDTTGTTGVNTGSGTYGSNGYGNINAIPSTIRYSIKTGQVGGQDLPYIDADMLPQNLLPGAKLAGGPAGVPVLDQNGKNALNAAQQILSIVDASKLLAMRNLGGGTWGRVSDSAKSWLNNFLQFNPDLSNFDQLRDAASKATTALAGGTGSGFRMNMGIIEAAIGNLPRASDNLETALTRADALGTQILNGLQPVFPQVSQGKYGNLLQSNYTGNQSGGNSSVSIGNSNFKLINGKWVAQ